MTEAGNGSPARVRKTRTSSTSAEKVARIPLRLVSATGDRATTVDFLRDVADDLESDPGVRCVVVVDRGRRPSVRFVPSGGLERSQDRPAVVLHKAAHTAMHCDSS